MKKFLIILFIGYALNSFLDNPPSFNGFGVSQVAGSSDDALQKAYDNRISDLQVKGTGTVYRNLPDDLDGSRHQKFLIRTSTGQSILVAHNIDVSNKINSLAIGDTVEFNGEYEWNQKGGTIHWTHHDPNGHHIDGWLKHDGVIYQ